MVQTGALAAWFSSAGCLVQLLQSLSHVLLTQLRSKALHQSIKTEQDYLAALGCSFLFVILVSLLYAVCLAAWLAITSAVVFVTARAMLQSVLRRRAHDNCSRAIVLQPRDICRVLPFGCLYVCVCVWLPLRVLTAYDVRSCVCA